MPFKLVAVGGGYKVQDDKGKFFSEKPLPKARAAAQMRALYANVPEASASAPAGKKARLTPKTGKPAVEMAPNVGGGVNRAQLPATDFVDPERRRFPIVTPADVMDAVHSYGRASPPIPYDQFKKRVMAIARRKGPAFVNALPAEWKKPKAAPGSPEAEEKHLQGKHDQASHGRRGGKRGGNSEQDRLNRARQEYEAAPWRAWMRGKELSSLAIYKDKDGEMRWVLFSSNAFRDQDGEIVSTKALTEDVDQAVAANKETAGAPDYGPLRWWHVEGADLGRCDYRTYSDSGRTLIESGTFHTPEIGQRIKEAAPHLQVSIGFNHPPSEPNDAGVYQMIRVFERSILPQGRAANPFTKVLVKGDEPMVSKKDKLKALKALLGEEAEAILAAADESEKELDEAGVAFKEAEDPEDQEDLEDYEDDEEEDLEEEEKAAKPGKKPMPMAEDEEDMEEEYMEDETPVIGNMPVEEYKSMLKEAFGAALEPVTKALMSNRKKQAEAGETVEALEQRLAELQKNEESMTKEIKRLTRQLKELSGETPRAARGYRASEDEDTIVDETEQKELGAPTQDPFAVSFVNDLLGINPSRQ